MSHFLNRDPRTDNSVRFLIGMQGFMDRLIDSYFLKGIQGFMDRWIDPNFERGCKDQRTGDSVRTSKGGWRDSQTMESIRECKDQRTVELVRIWKRNSGIHGPPVCPNFQRGFRDPQTAGLVQFFKGDSGIHGPPIWSKFSKKNAGILGPLIGSEF